MLPVHEHQVDLSARFSQYLGNDPTRPHSVFHSVALVGLVADFSALNVDSSNARLRDLLDPYTDPLGECPAVEVFRFRDKDGYFGQSPEPRHVRPPHLNFRVGQVVKHKL